MKNVYFWFVVSLSLLLFAMPAWAADQTLPGSGNTAAISLSQKSPLVQSAKQLLVQQAKQIQNATLRRATLDAIDNPKTCVTHRAKVTDSQKTTILQNLVEAGLVDTADETKFPGGLKAGVFPPLLQDGSKCPQLPQTFFSAPGSAQGSHHSYPGGLPLHEAFNQFSDLSFASNYLLMYGYTRSDGMPVIKPSNFSQNNLAQSSADIYIDRDIIIGAPIWHDWAKTMVFQWNSDGSEFQELNFGGNGKTDNYGSPGDSKTGSHHIIGLAEAIKRGLPPDFVIAQASAHSAPSLGNEYKVVNWLHAAAILAQIDPVKQGYLYKDNQNHLRLPPLRRLGSLNITTTEPSQTNLLAEYSLHSLSDADFVFSVPAVTILDKVVLPDLAFQFGYNPKDTAKYNNSFRNPVLSYLSAERLLITYGNKGLDGVIAEVNKLRQRGVI